MITLLDFYADWCVPCKKLEPFLQELQSTYPSINITKVNIDTEKEITEKYNINVIPTIIILDESNKTLSKIEGYDTIKLTNEIKKFV
jgi:thioredoxin 1